MPLCGGMSVAHVDSTTPAAPARTLTVPPGENTAGMPPTRLGRLDLQQVTAGFFEMARTGERKASPLCFALMDPGAGSDGVMGVANRFAIKEDAKEAPWLGMMAQGEINSLKNTSLMRFTIGSMLGSKSKRRKCWWLTCPDTTVRRRRRRMPTVRLRLRQREQ